MATADQIAGPDNGGDDEAWMFYYCSICNVGDISHALAVDLAINLEWYRNHYNGIEIFSCHNRGIEIFYPILKHWYMYNLANKSRQ